MPRRPPKKARNTSPLPSSAPSPTPNNRQQVEENDREQDEVPVSVNEEESGSQVSRPMTDQEELIRAQKIAKTAVSSSYASYHVPQLSQQLDKNGRQMIAYPCKM
ncbi:hypothetical protein PGTUg99_032344 [Puccinia graminis f. sp. tritici]|uniref:Uncharacterized protein n=1 Tax=Puccinia graminis f. sp. tritici TaxID=56615 RepID=A0A5B0P0F8_PUCGR|nr:hypothetical protein PGTUg99_032344 [Puccinia graminis f. sp. tritici]